nr:hypothetical protein [Rahnella sp. WMR114]
MHDGLCIGIMHVIENPQRVCGLKVHGRWQMKGSKNGDGQVLAYRYYDARFTRNSPLLATMQDRQSHCGCAHPPRVSPDPAGGSRTSTAANALRLFKPPPAHNKW